MYKEFLTRNFNEYKKIEAVIDSTTKPEQFEVVEEMVMQFAKNCDFRLSKLKRRAWIDFLNGRKWDEYFYYKKSTNLQIESIVELCGCWKTQYSNWLEEQRIEEENQEALNKKKIDIKGFNSLFKKKTRAKKRQNKA